MLDLPPSTVAPTVVEHVLQWSNSTVGAHYFQMAKSEHKPTAALPNSSDKPIRVEPSASSSSAILNRLRTFASWTVNWDGEGAAAPNLGAIETASNFLSLWSPSKVTPEIVLTHDGLPMFVIEKSGLFGEIIVNGDDTIDYFLEPVGGAPKGAEAVQYHSEAMLSILKELT